MNVAHILFSKGWGGLERYAITQASAMAERGHNIYFLAREGSQTAEAARENARLRVISMAPYRYIDLRAILSLRSFVKREDIRIVHAHHSADLGLAAPALWRLGGVRLIFSNYMRVPAPKKDIYHRLEYGRVERVLTGAEDLRINTIENLPVSPDIVETLPYGVDMERFNPDSVKKGALRRTLGAGADVPLIGVISRLDPLKGQMEMIKAMPVILARHPGAILVLTGDETPELTGTYLPLLREQVKEAGVERCVVFTGQSEDTASILADLDVYALPSYAETFSLGCLEAMAMRKPVVGTNAGGTPEMLDHGACGLLAAPGDHDSLARAVIKLLDDKPLRERLADAAYEKVRARYSRERTMDRLDAIYRGQV